MKKVINWIRREIKEQGLLVFMAMMAFMIPYTILCFPFFLVGSFFEWLNEKSKGLVGEIYE